MSGPDLSHCRPDGTLAVVLTLEGVLGFNDIYADGSGRVYAGTLRPGQPDEPDSTAPGECWRLGDGGSAVQLYSNVGLSNGIEFSPDGRLLLASHPKARST